MPRHQSSLLLASSNGNPNDVKIETDVPSLNQMCFVKVKDSHTRGSLSNPSQWNNYEVIFEINIYSLFLITCSWSASILQIYRGA